MSASPVCSIFSCTPSSRSFSTCMCVGVTATPCKLKRVAETSHDLLERREWKSDLLQSLHDGLDIIMVQDSLCQQLLNADERDAGELGRPDVAGCEEGLQDLLKVRSQRERSISGPHFSVMHLMT